MGSIPGSGRSPRVGNSNSLQYSCLENSIDGGAWQATVHGVAVRQLKRVSTHTIIYKLNSNLKFPGHVLLCFKITPISPEHNPENVPSIVSNREHSTQSCSILKAIGEDSVNAQSRPSLQFGVWQLCRASSEGRAQVTGAGCTSVRPWDSGFQLQLPYYHCLRGHRQRAFGRRVARQV